MSVTPVLMVAASLLLLSRAETRDFFHWLMEENKPVEVLTFVSLLLAGLVGVRLAVRLHHLGREPMEFYFVGVFATGLLFVAMEEISWGQWVVGFETPAAWQELNRQGETNLHNLHIVNQLFELLRLLFGVGGLVGIWLRHAARLRLIAPAPVLASWFVVITALAGLDFVNIFVAPVHRGLLLSVAGMLVEVLELLIGLAALLYMMLTLRAARCPIDR